jgi:flavodoxin
MHEDGTASDDFCAGVGTLQGILQKSRTEALPLLPLIDGQASKQNDRDRIRG